MLIGQKIVEHRICVNGHNALTGRPCSKCAKLRAQRQSKLRKHQRQYNGAARSILGLEGAVMRAPTDQIQAQLQAELDARIAEFQLLVGDYRWALEILEQLRAENPDDGTPEYLKNFNNNA